MNETRPNIVFCMNKLSRYTNNQGPEHCDTILRVLKYHKETLDYELFYTRKPTNLEEYSDAN